MEHALLEHVCASTPAESTNDSASNSGINIVLIKMKLRNAHQHGVVLFNTTHKLYFRWFQKNLHCCLLAPINVSDEHLNARANSGMSLKGLAIRNSNSA